ncbi:hypothetical protein [Wenjunlia tyrosinilytica]|uniref:hypothetical protein n=1 Tax=Wenjunlia tyrosinilytica TaxID=1544741 RepID=UPI00166CF4C6|nr:hypothetical protein [Wenjunlia tyrosinilytica]
MSAVNLILPLLAAATAAAPSAAVLVAVRGLRREVRVLRVEVAQAAEASKAAQAPRAADAPLGERAGVPAARSATEDLEGALRRRTEIRDAVAEALAEERERELAEARAFWAAQEARETADAPFLDGRLDDAGDCPSPPPRQVDLSGLDAFRQAPNTNIHGPFDQQFTDALREAIDELAHEDEDDADHPEPAVPDMRRHPSHPDFRPTPVVADQERTTDRLLELAESGTPLTDVRPGPMGTLDIYVFGDGTTLCVTPGNRPATERLAEALRRGETATLLGGSGVGGAYALTFGVGDESVYLLADRVVTSI